MDGANTGGEVPAGPRDERGRPTGTELPGVELADAVAAVRAGLVSAAERAEGQSLRFELGDIEMEFTVEVRRDARARGGVKAWVVDAGAEAGGSRGRTHKVSFTLKPRYADGSDGYRIAADTEGRSWDR
jgi:Trypsin-co-occurring domain 2